MSIAEVGRTEIVEELSAKEKREKIRQEAIVEHNLRSFVECGTALRVIRDQRLYRETYGTFDAYLLGKWGLDRSSGYALIDAARVVQTIRAAESDSEMSAIADISLPTNVAQTRAMSGLPEGEIVSTWVDALEIAKPTGKPPTAKIIKEAADARKPAPTPADTFEVRCLDCETPLTGAGRAHGSRIVPGGSVCIPCFTKREGLSSLPSLPKLAIEYDEAARAALERALTLCPQLLEGMLDEGKTIEFVAAHCITELVKQLADAHVSIAGRDGALENAREQVIAVRAEMEAAKRAAAELRAQLALHANEQIIRDNDYAPPAEAPARAPQIGDRYANVYGNEAQVTEILPSGRYVVSFPSSAPMQTTAELLSKYELLPAREAASTVQIEPESPKSVDSTARNGTEPLEIGTLTPENVAPSDPGTLRVGAEYERSGQRYWVEELNASNGRGVKLKNAYGKSGFVSYLKLGEIYTRVQREGVTA